MAELLPCPFCGGEAEVLTAESMNGGYLFGIMCNDCSSRGDVYDTEAEAIAAWNTRANGSETAKTSDNAPLRTCEDVNTRFNAWTCSECKCTLLLMFDDYGEPTLNVDGVASVPNYCPNCGACVTKSNHNL